MPEYLPRELEEIAQARKEAGLPPLGQHQGMTICLRCEESFFSEDKTRLRICPACKDQGDEPHPRFLEVLDAGDDHAPWDYCDDGFGPGPSDEWLRQLDEPID